METGKMRKLAIVCASEMTIKAFLMEHIRALSKVYQVTVFADTGDHSLLQRNGINTPIIRVGIARKIQPAQDLLALIRLYSLLRNGQFDAVHSFTPKAGLIAMIAAVAGMVPRRLHTFTGQVWATRTGMSRLLLKAADSLTGKLATHVLVDSRSQMRFLIDERVLSEAKGTVLASGSISGVDIERFKPDRAAGRRIRTSMGIGENEFVFAYIGRLNRDKGVLNLCKAFSQLEMPNAHLLLVGPDEERIAPEIESLALERLHIVGSTSEPEAFYSAANVFCLASLREGFGTSVIEAAACGLPTIGSRIYGIVDAVVDGRTGLLFSPGKVSELSDLMRKLATEPGTLEAMGEQARQRAVRDFSSSTLVKSMLAYYQDTVRLC